MEGMRTRIFFCVPVILLLAAASSANALALLWPAEPMRPQRVVTSVPALEISQNLEEEPLANSKWRGLPALVVAAAATGIFGDAGILVVDLAGVPLAALRWLATGSSARTPT